MIQDPEMVNQEVGITGITIQDMKYPPTTGCPLTSWKDEQVHLQLGRYVILKDDIGLHSQYTHVRLTSMERGNSEPLLLLPPSQISAPSLTVHTCARIHIRRPKGHEVV